MTLVAIIPLIVCIVGAIVFIVTTNANVKQLALWAYAAGLLATLFAMAGHAVRIG